MLHRARLLNSLEFVICESFVKIFNTRSKDVVCQCMKMFNIQTYCTAPNVLCKITSSLKRICKCTRLTSHYYSNIVYLFFCFIFNFLPSALWRCWFGVRKSIPPLKSLTDEVQIACILFSWCHCHPIISASPKSRMVYPSGTDSPG